MSWDLALSPNSDLIFAANLDWQFVDGDALLNQRIITRLRMVRGSWMLDRSSLLGSHLNEILSEPLTQGAVDIPALAMDALSPMDDEIDVRSIDVKEESHGFIVIVNYSRTQPDLPPSQTPPNTIQLAVQLGGDT